jgi:uncharacterized protein (TIGR02145 family)
VNATGTITVTFTCGSTQVSDVNNNTYNTVSIGSQCWLKENLRVRRYNDGTEIKFDTSGGVGGNLSYQTWGGLTYGAYTIFAHDSSANLTNYGYLYNMYAVLGIATTSGAASKNICPVGWHVPSKSDWNVLLKFVDNAADTTANASLLSSIAGKLKSTSLWNSPNTGADNANSFLALPGGYRTVQGTFTLIRSDGYIWSSENGVSGSDPYGYYISFVHNSANVRRANNSFNFGASVRCVKD